MLFVEQVLEKILTKYLVKIHKIRFFQTGDEDRGERPVISDQDTLFSVRYAAGWHASRGTIETSTHSEQENDFRLRLQASA